MTRDPAHTAAIDASPPPALDAPRQQRVPRPPRRALHGVLLVDKPLGWTSQDALAKCKGLLRAEKGGHTGTLDPLATGLLPLCFGAATKYAQASLDADKRYTATLRLGVTTATGDGEGEVLQRRSAAGVSRADLQALLHRFTGAIEQTPPMHSALKHAGRALYLYAREGRSVERPARQVVVHALDILDWQAAGDEVLATLDVHCSKGTYVRTLGEDLGAALGCGATLAALRRTGVGTLRLDDAIGVQDLAALDDAARVARLLPVDTLLQGWPAVSLPGDEAGRFLTGLRRRVALADAAAVRVYTDTAPRAFLGSAHITAGELIADRLLSPLEVQSSS